MAILIFRGPQSMNLIFVFFSVSETENPQLFMFSGFNDLESGANLMVFHQAANKTKTEGFVNLDFRLYYYSASTFLLIQI